MGLGPIMAIYQARFMKFSNGVGMNTAQLLGFTGARRDAGHEFFDGRDGTLRGVLDRLGRAGLCQRQVAHVHETLLSH